MDQKTITTRLAFRLAKHAAETKARLSAIPNNMVIVMDEDVREQLVSGYLSSFQEGALFVLNELKADLEDIEENDGNTE